jgi:hypothetical protein
MQDDVPERGLVERAWTGVLRSDRPLLHRSLI